MHEKPRNTEGSTIYLVALVLILVEVLVLSLHGRSLDSARLAHRVHARQVCAHLADGARASVIAALRHDLARTETSRFRAMLLKVGDSSRLQGALVPLPAGWDRELQKEVARLGDVQLTSVVRLQEVAPLLDDSSAAGEDAHEKRGLLEMTFTVTLLRVPLTYTFRTPFKIVNLIPPVTSKFTLFVKHPERTGIANAGYNRFRNLYDGDAVSGAEAHPPLVLFNEEGLALRELTGRGFVFLGGGDPVMLQITNGSHPRFGEGFHFEATADPRGELAGGTDPASASLLGAFTEPGATFSVQRSFLGFYERDEAGEGLNAEGRLRKDFAAGRTTSSSMLHLYGSAERRSPTVVVGNVQRSFALISHLAVDVDADGKADDAVAVLPGVGWEDYPLQIPLLPNSFTSFTDPSGSIDLRPLKSSDPELHDFVRLFGDYAQYSTLMSRLVEEPYNRGFDWMAGYEPGKLGAPAVLPASRYPDPGTSFNLVLADGGVHFQGDLNAFSTLRLEARAVVEVADEAELKQRFIRDGRLELGRVVRVAQGPVTLPARLEVGDGGAIIAAGSITSSGVRNRSSVPLALCSTEGDLIVDSTYPDHEFAGIALAGGLKTLGSDPVHIKGALAVDHLSPDELRAGGELTYDPRLDPTAPGYAGFYRTFIADAEKEWVLP